jgi:hypothetical protein
MISFHCPIQTNEHIFSWLNRIHLLSGNAKLAHTLKYLSIENMPFKSCNHNQAFLNLVDFFKTKIADDASAFDKHSPLALWSLSYDFSEYNNWRITNTDIMSSGYGATQFSFKSNWQYCPFCVQDDIRLHGHSTWHVKHQLPSVSHCYIHQTKLVGNPHLLLDLRKSSLPQIHNFSPPNFEDEALLLEWSLFVFTIYDRLNNSPKFGQKLTNRIKRYLSIPDEIKYNDPDIFKSLQEQFDNDVPLNLCRHLFLLYKNNSKKQATILKSTLGYSYYKKYKHPVYWLIILFWLKDKVSLEDS